MTNTFASDLRQMLEAWNQIERAAREQFPGVSPEELQEICSGAMNHALGLDTKDNK